MKQWSHCRITLQKLKDQLSQPQFPIFGGAARLKKDTNVLNSKVTDMENKNSPSSSRCGK